MLDPYHPQSPVAQPDGWLGLMVGSQLWYPCWDVGDVEKVAMQVRDRMEQQQGEERCRRESRRPEAVLAALGVEAVADWLWQKHEKSHVGDGTGSSHGVEVNEQVWGRVVEVFSAQRVGGKALLCLHRAAKREPARQHCQSPP
jgi:hypothetical protein